MCVNVLLPGRNVRRARRRIRWQCGVRIMSMLLSALSAVIRCVRQIKRPVSMYAKRKVIGIFIPTVGKAKGYGSKFRYNLRHYSSHLGDIMIAKTVVRRPIRYVQKTVCWLMVSGKRAAGLPARSRLPDFRPGKRAGWPRSGRQIDVAVGANGQYDENGAACTERRLHVMNCRLACASAADQGPVPVKLLKLKTTTLWLMATTCWLART
ncbi:hypothetical protein BANRA_00008 [Klebsiella pneumoniae]|nr:hypothetical protein BANRA_00008 [Klebsiella pneumoniae]